MQTVVSLLTQALSMCTSKRDLARRLGCSEQNLQALMKGARHLTVAQVIALGNMTGVPPSEVLVRKLAALLDRLARFGPGTRTA